MAKQKSVTTMISHLFTPHALHARTTVPNRDKVDPDYDDSDQIRDFIEQEYEEDDRLLLTNKITPYEDPPYTHITTEEVGTYKLHGGFFSETHRNLDRGCRYRSK